MKWALTTVLVLAMAASASYPRLATLGGDPRLMLEDYVEMWAYPGTISDYEFATGQSDGTGDSDGWFGLVKNFDGSTLGVTINHGNMLEVLYHPGTWGMIAGLDYDKATAFAESIEVTTKDISLDANWGTDIGMFGDYSDLAIGVGYSKNTTTTGEDPEQGDSRIEFGASVRGHRDAFINLFPIISAGVQMSTLIDGDDDTEDAKSTSISIDLGAGHNHFVAPQTAVVVGVYTGVVSTSYSGDAYENWDSRMHVIIPRITGGIEQYVGKWITFRAGATSHTEYDKQGDVNSFSTDFSTDFGIGLHWENFTVDATITEGFLHDGPYMIGGDGENGFMSTLAATYTF